MQHAHHPATLGPARRGTWRRRVVVRALRLLPAGVPDLPGARRGDGLAARPHRADEGGARRRAAAGRRAAAHRPLPRLPGLRDGLPVRRPLRRSHHAVPRAPRERARGARWSRALQRGAAARDAAVSPRRFALGAAPGPHGAPLRRRCCRRRSRAMLGLLPARVPPAQPLPALTPAPRRRAGRAWRCWPAACSRCCARRSTPPRSACCRATASRWSCRRARAAAARSRCTSATRRAPAARRRAQPSRAFPADVDADRHHRGRLRLGDAGIPASVRGRRRCRGGDGAARRAVDISVFLEQLGVSRRRRLPEPITVAYHDACHLRTRRRASPSRARCSPRSATCAWSRSRMATVLRLRRDLQPRSAGASRARLGQRKARSGRSRPAPPSSPPATSAA